MLALPANTQSNSVGMFSGEFARSPFRSSAIALTLVLQGCITAPKLDRQQQTIANGHLGLAEQVSTPIPVQAWWSAFNDPQLDRPMRQALADNPNLAQAMAGVREAQSLRRTRSLPN
jgi:outer membrane protein TolC